MNPSRELIDAIRRRRIEDARRMDPVDKMFAGAALHDVARQRMMIGIRMQMPDADEATIHRMLRERLERQHLRDECR